MQHNLTNFDDRGTIGIWAQPAVSQAVEAGIITGVTAKSFKPLANATHAQATVMLKRMLQYVQFIN